MHLLQAAVNPLGIKYEVGQARYAMTGEVIRQVFRCDGFSGFYRGYTASLCTYVPNSALWWAFYHFYQGTGIFVLINVENSKICYRFLRLFSTKFDLICISTKLQNVYKKIN